ncbi:MAG: Alkaline phosphatase [Polyangiaceae bacterium]|nr:Alkaline phosphatase [Polyangiaceae bacterium]
MPNRMCTPLKEQKTTMIRTKNGFLKGLVITLTSVLPATVLSGCSSEVSEPQLEEVTESAAELGVAVATCSTAASSGYNATTSALAITMSTPNVVIGVVGGFITVNGYACVKPTAAGGAKLTPTMVKQITITGTAANEKVVVDSLSGSFGPSVLSTAGGIVVNLGTGTDSFSLRGTSGADKYTAGKSGADSYFEISGDAVADIRVVAADTMAVSLSGGADIFSGRGGAIAGTHLITGTTVSALTALSANIVVNGGDGDDTLTGGDGVDTLSGGEGNDLFKTSVGATADGNDSYVGGGGIDKMDYSGRTANLTVTMDGVAGSGQATESDTVAADIESLIGGTGNDTLSGNALSNDIKGGAGDDIIWGGVAGACSATVDVDTLDGEAGNDTFKMTATADCMDSLTGGPGTDTADYQLRTATLTITLDNGALDGETNEKDNVKSDIEVVIGGTNGDTITGSSANDELHGGPGVDTLNGGGGDDTLIGNSGNDILNGEAGNDTFDDGAVDPLFTTAEQKGTGGDVMNGGTGVDTVTYSERTASVIVTLCMDPNKLTGNTALVTANCTDSDGEALEADKIVNVTHIIGGGDDDTITGSTGDDMLEGGAGGDTIKGGLGADSIFGDAGDDFLYGDAGDDSVDGGAGDDAVNGDSLTGGNVADGDICVSDAADTTLVAANCDL